MSEWLVLWTGSTERGATRGGGARQSRRARSDRHGCGVGEGTVRHQRRCWVRTDQSWGTASSGIPRIYNNVIEILNNLPKLSIFCKYLPVNSKTKFWLRKIRINYLILKNSYYKWKSKLNLGKADIKFKFEVIFLIKELFQPLYFQVPQNDSRRKRSFPRGDRGGTAAKKAFFKRN